MSKNVYILGIESSCDETAAAVVKNGHPQLIQKLFNAYWFGPPDGVTHPSAWPRVDHLVSRLLLPTVRPIQTRFRFGCTSQDA